MRPLVVLDINGVLVHRSTMTNFNLRPYLDECLDALFDLFDVAIFTSMTKKYGSLAVNQIFTGEQQEMLKFVWYRDRTSWDPEYGKIKTVKQHDTVKPLSYILDSPTVNDKRQYDRFNVVMVDDSHRKMKINTSDNYIIVESYEGKDKEDETLFLLPFLLQERFEMLEVERDRGIFEGMEFLTI